MERYICPSFNHRDGIQKWLETHPINEFAVALVNRDKQPRFIVVNQYGYYFASNGMKGEYKQRIIPFLGKVDTRTVKIIPLSCIISPTEKP